MRHILKLALAATGLLMITGAARTERQFLLIPASDVTAHADADTALGQYYTLDYRLPEGLAAEQVDLAVLEMYLDVRAKARDEYVNETPVLEVYALRQPFAGAIDPEVLDRETRAVRPVALGHHRRVLLDITEIVRAHLTGRLANHGLILGSVADRREGDITVEAGKFPGDGVARVRLYTRPVVAR